MRPIVPPDVAPYSYAGTGYANPNAVTEVANGLTSTIVYDAGGNLFRKPQMAPYAASRITRSSCCRVSCCALETFTST
jgi:hypothetical protein